MRLEDPEYEANLLLVNTYAMNGIIEEAGCLSRALLFGSILCVTRYTFSKAGFVNLAERRDLQRLQMECTLDLSDCNIQTLESLYHKYCDYLGDKRALQLKGMWDSLEEPRTIIFRRALSVEYKVYVQKYLADNVRAAVALLEKHELKPCAHLESLKDAWVHNMYQEKIFGAQSEVQKSSRGGIQRTRGHTLALINGTFATDLQMAQRRKSRFLGLRKKGQVTDDEWDVWNKKEQRADALLSFFNEKYNPVANRHATIRALLKNRKAASLELRQQVHKQVERGLEILETANEVGVFPDMYLHMRTTEDKLTHTLLHWHRTTERGTRADARNSTSGKL